MKFRLSAPIYDDVRPIRELVFRKANLGDIALHDRIAAVEGETAATIAVLAAMSSTPLDVIMQIRTADLHRLNHAMKPLFEGPAF